MPSTTSRVVSRLFASSTVMTPSLPTLLMASAMMSPIVESLLAEMVPTCAISFWSLVGFESDLSPSKILPTARSTPRFRLIGSCPATTIFRPSVKIARASTVAVVVPSPATSEVLEATSFTICAPMFSNLSSISISFATVTPSLVTFGAPKDFSRMTLRPRGPSVATTASASRFTPRRILSRASWWNLMILAPMSALHHGQDVVLAHDEELLAVDLDFRARVFPEEDLVADLDVERGHFALVVHLALAGRDHLAVLRLLLRRVGDVEPALRLLHLVLEPLHENAVLQWPDLHFP